MKAVFELKQIMQSWSKPKEPKKISVKEVVAEQDEQFDTTEKNEPMFKLLKIERDKALVEYNRAYTLKGYEQPLNRNVWMEIMQAREFSSLWNNNGITKKLTLKRVEPAEAEPATKIAMEPQATEGAESQGPAETGPQNA